jgi:RNA polymerase sigma factor (sigma-70 family)
MADNSMSHDSVADKMQMHTNDLDSDKPDSDKTTSTDAASITGNETMIDIETGELIGVARRQSFADFYQAERPPIVRALSLALHDTDFGVDAADEAFVRACQSWSSVGALANPAGWVYRVGLNWAHSALRKRRRHRAKQALLVTQDVATDRPPDIDLQRALAKLSDAHRSVVICRYYLDWTVVETADALSIAPGTVKSRLSRALEQLESTLRPTHSPSPENGIQS